MASIKTDQTYISQQTQQVFDQVASQSQNRLYQMSGSMMIFNDEDISTAWNALGQYIARNLRMGRGIQIQNFGIFTLSAPEISLDGVTNKNLQDKEGRVPVFIISKDFCKGRDIKSGIFIGEILRQYQVIGVNGNIPQQKANFIEVSTYARKNKEEAKICIYRVIKNLEDQARNKNVVNIDIPNVGVLKIRNGLAGVQFNEFLCRETKDVCKKPLQEKIQRGDMTLTKEKLTQFQFFQQQKEQENIKTMQKTQPILDQSGKDYLQKKMNIDVDELFSQKNKEKTVFRDIQNTQQLQKTLQNEEANLTQTGLQILTFWIRNKHLNKEDSFIEFCKYCKGKVQSNTKLNENDVIKGLLNMDIDMSSDQANGLFKELDYNKDGLVCINDWVKVIKDDTDNQLLQRIKDIIKRQNLKLDDVFKTMLIDRKSTKIDLQTLSKALRLLDLTLNEQKSVLVAKTIMENKEFIDSQQIIKILCCQMDNYLEESRQLEDLNWHNDMLLRIKKLIGRLKDPNIVEELFQKADIRNCGKINTSIFKTCIIDMNLGISVKDLNRLMRYIEKEYDGLIDYNKFLNSLKRVDCKLQGNQNIIRFVDSIDFYEKLTLFLKRQGIKNAGEFLQEVFQLYKGQVRNINDLNIQIITEHLHRQAFPNTNIEDLESYVSQLDIDKDGIISQEDLDTFLERINYINSHLDKLVPNKVISNNKVNLFPSKLLPYKQIESILQELRQVMKLKKISQRDLFTLLDNNNDGFITISEFSSKIDQILNFSQQVKDGIFAFMDSQQIGMVDYQAFQKAINASAIDLKETYLKENQKNSQKSTDWQYTQSVLQEIRQWFSKENINIEDAFRIIDQDFDGFISKHDLKTFLEQTLYKQDLNAQKINRIFKLFDFHKRGMVQLADLKKILLNNQCQEEEEDIQQETWIQHAKQQLGLTISRKFANLQQSFDVISNNQMKMLFKPFNQWIEQSRALIGFELTFDQLQKFFSSLDPHKKGYLTIIDWKNVFSNFNWKREMRIEIKELLQENFTSKNSAFQYFVDSKTSNYITYQSFCSKIKSILKNRFTNEDIQQLWFKISDPKDHILDKNAFFALFDEKFPLNELKRAKTEANTIRKKSIIIEESENAFLNEIDEEDVIQKVKKLLNGNNQLLDSIFSQLDPQQTGKVSIVQFKNGIRALGLNLKAKEIDKIVVQFEEGKDGFIKYNNFLQKFKQNQATHRIENRQNLRLKKINQDLHYYMISPIDAFRQFNNDHTGKMTFSQFTTFIQKLCQMANEDVPSFDIIKDIFLTIDTRNEGFIDQNQWIKVFGKFKIDQEARKSLQQFNQINADKMITNVNDFNNLIAIIGRNRKFLIEQFKKLKQPLTYQLCVEIMRHMFNNVGIQVGETCFAKLIKFAEREGKIIDYKFMLDVYKDRFNKINIQPNILN